MSNSDDLLRLQLSPSAMRDLGYAVIDRIVEHVVALPDKPVTRRASREELERRLREPLPVSGTDPLAVLETIGSEVLDRIMHVDHPRFFGFIPSPSNYVSVMADALATGFNVFAGTWLESSAAAEIELVTVDWLRDLAGLPASGGGVLTSGGSLANITALAAARHVELEDDTVGAVVYGTDQTHSSIRRALHLLGFAPDAWRALPSDETYRFDVGALRQAIRNDRAAGRRPFCVVATPGTTNTGSVDPLAALAEVCENEGLWLHADAAVGGAALFSARGKRLLDGIERIDSLVFDPHKWLFQPYEIGCVLVRERSWLPAAFGLTPEYLRDAAGEEAEPNFYEYGPQLTRGFRALKLWMSLKVFGADAFGAAVEHGFRLAEAAERAVRELPDWRMVAPAQMGILAFRYAPSGAEAELDALNDEVAKRLIDDGFAMVSSTSLRGRTALHMSCINPRTSETDVRDTIAKLDHLAWRARAR